MEGFPWIPQPWLDLFQTVAIVGGLFFTAYSTRRDERARKVGFLIELNKQHQRIWEDFSKRPELFRVLERTPEIEKVPITIAERIFTNSVILQLEAVYHAIKRGMLVPLDGLKADIRDFFSLPIPSSVWQKSRRLQNSDFVDFVDSSLKESGS